MITKVIFTFFSFDIKQGISNLKDVTLFFSLIYYETKILESKLITTKKINK